MIIKFGEFVMMKCKCVQILGLAFLLTGITGKASAVVLDFEDLLVGESIEEFYNGGTGGFGSSGPDYGVEFLGDVSVSLYDFIPSTSGSQVANFTMSIAGINVGDGFTSISLAHITAGTVNMYFHDGLDGSGNLLGALNLSSGAEIFESADFCEFNNCWENHSLDFGGIARSITFEGVAFSFLMDDMDFNLALNDFAPGGGSRVNVLEPSTALLLAVGLLGLGGKSLRVRKRSC